MRVEKQIAYWSNGSQSDIEAAHILVSGAKPQQGLYLAHLALEKALKAHVVRTTHKHPPKIHSLLVLSRHAELRLSPKDEEFLSAFDIYQMQGRYPDSEWPALSKATVQHDLKRASEIQQWLIQKL